MTAFNEVLFISDNSETANSIHCHDIQLNARVMMYKGGHGVARRTLSFIEESYIISAGALKPFLYVWAFNREDSVKRFFLPGKVTAMAVSSNGIYCVAAIENKIYIWNIASGQLMNVISYHHEGITKILFWHCGYFITSGEDGLVAVWRLADVLSRETGDAFSTGQLRSTLPFFSSSQHSLPVTDMHLATAGSTARLFTISADQTCQIYSLGPEGGKFLLTLTFDFILSSITVDRLQRKLLVGTDCGRIMLYPMEPCHDVTVRHIDCSQDENCFLGHTAAVTSLSLSREDTFLASGSNDKKVIIWNVVTRQQIAVHDMFGSVTSVIFRVMSGDFLATNTKPRCLISTFERTVLSDPDQIEIKILVENDLTSEDSGFEEEVTLWKSETRLSDQRRLPGCLPAVVPNDQAINSDSDSEEWSGSAKVNGLEGAENEREEGCGQDLNMEGEHCSAATAESDLARLIQENRRLRRINRNLYLFALEQSWENGHIKNRRQYQM